MNSQQIQDLIKRVRPMVNDPGVRDVCTLLKLFTEQWKDELVTAKTDDVLKLQGAILNVRDILYELHRGVKIQDFRNGAYTGEAT